jgi:hypothetical protein
MVGVINNELLLTLITQKNIPFEQIEKDRCTVVKYLVINEGCLNSLEKINLQNFHFTQLLVPVSTGQRFR